MQQQNDLVAAARHEEIVSKSKETHQQMFNKLEEIHNAYKKVPPYATQYTTHVLALQLQHMVIDVTWKVICNL